MRHKRKNQAEEVLSPFPHLLAAEESKSPSSIPPYPALVPSAAPETPILGEVAAGMRKREQGAAPSPLPPPSAAAQTSIRKEEEGVRVGKKKRKRRENMEDNAASSPTPPAATRTLLVEVVHAEAAAARKKEQKRRKEQQEPFDDHTHCLQLQRNPSPSPSGLGREEADGQKSKSVKRSSSKKRRIQIVSKITRIESRKQPPLPEGFFKPPDIASNPNADFTAFFHQFAYKPRCQDHSSPVPRMPDHVARPPSQVCPSSGSSQLIANKTSKINTSKTSKIPISKTDHPASGSTTKKQEKTKLKEMEKPVKKDRKPAPLLTRAEKQSNKYRRLPLDQLVPPPRSPHKLLQEKYASDPWKVLVICMLLNKTQGKQVRKKVKGFFRRYPDAQTAFNADPEKMVNYLAPLGLPRVKAGRIQKFSKAYIEKEWTYVTELCGVGKYAADAYAIFCAGKAKEVVPADHKLVDYWKYVCFELPMIQQSKNIQEAEVTEKHAVPEVEELPVCC
ncbi:hypothetical protein GUJ93_ZPchr0015g6642 [Zizania palustris]|uniref:HhH-GPD domain-containing protein n=1 Tax=Zizania palustris TaxID=103762 RepID=A0A8J5THJ3_ZIZPA|nr:hypothetical protein GUJ93_ZPchr0015g6642 [Zizania palustris]